MTILEGIIKSLHNLGGKGYYQDIYDEYEKVTGIDLTTSKKAGIRACIERHSSDSKVFKGKNDLFYSIDGIGKGYWGLR